MRAILTAIAVGLVTVDGAEGPESILLAGDARIQIPGVRSDQPIADVLTLLESEDPLVVVIEGTCNEAGVCTATRRHGPRPLDA